jgi:hypothetical protein
MKMNMREESIKRKNVIRAMILLLCIAVMSAMMPALGMADTVSAAPDIQLEEIDTIELNFTAPQCGYQGEPAVTVPAGAHYSVSKENKGYWYERPVKKGDKKYTDKLKGGKSYYAVFYLTSENGYAFKASTSDSSLYDGTVKVNGRTIKPTVAKYFDKGVLALAFSVDVVHKWDSGVVTKQATAGAEGTKTFTCTECGTTKNEPIAKTSGHNGEGGSPVGKGADRVVAEKYITSKAADYDLPGTTIAPMRLRAASRTKKAIVLGWNQVSGAAKYVVYGTMCGSKYKMKKLGEVTGTKFKVTKIKKKLKKTYYKFIVVAYDSQSKVLQATKTVHISPKGNKKKSVYKGVFLKVKAGSKYQNINSLTLSAGESVKLKYGPVLYKKTKVKRHVKIRFESSAPGVASVSAKGLITAVNPGTCTIYAYAQNGVGKALTITVQ